MVCRPTAKLTTTTARIRPIAIGNLVVMHADVSCYRVFTARRSYASAVLGVVILSVHPSACPSVCQTRAL